ncbi:MAG: alpha/beta fold hydrolase [Mycobacteriaceae bacterium]
MANPLIQCQVLAGDVRSPVLVGGPSVADLREAVVFVHGNPGSGADWRPLLDAVGEHTAVIAPDMPGFGGAEMRRDIDYTVAGYARHLGGIIDALGVDRVHLVAHDFGGPWSLTWAAANVDRVASVSLLNTGALLDYHWHRLARVWRAPVIGEVFQATAVPPAARALLAHDNPGLDRPSVEHLARLIRPWGTKRAILDLYRSTTQQMMDRLVAPLAAKDLPCQVIWGTRDVYIPTAQAYRQVEPFPSAAVHLVEGAGHWVWLERPDRVTDLLVPFIRRHLTTTTVAGTAR